MLFTSICIRERIIKTVNGYIVCIISYMGHKRFSYIKRSQKKTYYPHDKFGDDRNFIPNLCIIIF